jgi:hypothetical protein
VQTISRDSAEFPLFFELGGQFWRAVKRDETAPRRACLRLPETRPMLNANGNELPHKTMLANKTSDSSL